MNKFYQQNHKIKLVPNISNIWLDFFVIVEEKSYVNDFQAHFNEKKNGENIIEN